MRPTIRRWLSRSLFAAAAPALASTGCGGGGSSNTGTAVTSAVQRDTAPDVSATDVGDVVSGNTDFAFALYHGLSAGSGGSTTTNLFYSPYSVSLALAMTHAGANGETATQMAQALDFPSIGTRLNLAFDKLDLEIQTKTASAVGADGAAFALDVADALWGDERVTFGQPFVDTLSADYAAGLRTVDFVDQPSQAEAAINAWVANATDGKISPLLGPGAVTPATELFLVNAVYFNAGWATAFEPSATQTQTFTRADGSTVQTPMMNSSAAAWGYYKGSNYQATELRYSGGTAAMDLVLPDPGDYAAVEKGLGGSLYDAVTKGLSAATVLLTMPSFAIHGASVSLVPELKALGMTDAFDAKKADFTSMIPAGGAYISDVIHQAFIDVDESGTVAAAATAVGVAGDAVAVQTPTVPFVVNRTFFLFIRDVTTNTILFVGREDDPTAQ